MIFTQNNDFFSIIFDNIIKKDSLCNICYINYELIKLNLSDFILKY